MNLLDEIIAYNDYRRGIEENPPGLAGVCYKCNEEWMIGEICNTCEQCPDCCECDDKEK